MTRQKIKSVRRFSSFVQSITIYLTFEWIFDIFVSNMWQINDQLINIYLIVLGVYDETSSGLTIIRRLEDEDDRFKCEKCNKSYKHKNTLNEHKKYECDGIRRFLCQICGKSFTQNSNLKRHTVALHADCNLTLKITRRFKNKHVIVKKSSRK